MESLTTLIAAVLGLLFVCLTIYLANLDDQHGGRESGVKWMLFAILGINLFLGLSGLQSAASGTTPGRLGESQSAAQASQVSITQGAALVSFLLALTTSLLAFLMVSSKDARRTLARAIATHGTYNPDSTVHTAAIVLALVTLSINLVLFVLSGGIAGMAATIQEGGLSLDSVILQQVLWIAPALLGTGLLTRRSLPAVLARLGLRAPTLSDVTSGVLGGLVGFVVIIGFGILWTSLVTPEQFAEQTAASSQLAASVGSLTQAFLISAAVAIGEEVFFRGALQPVFGNLLTSLFFVAVHTQYTLTPATLAIFFVSLGLGWLRSRYSTNSAIIAHFIYNFLQLAAAVALSTFPSGT
jgi:hypothetical protein